MAARRIANPAVLICDLQEKFRPAIWQFDRVVHTTTKLIRAAQVLSLPIYATTQNAARLGPLVPEITKLLDEPLSQVVVNRDKTRFSMMIPELAPHFPPVTAQTTGSAGTPPSHVVLVGIESHICITQTTLDLLAAGHKVYILADGVSSCNKEEVPIALARLRAEGAVVTTSESVLYEIMGDAMIPEFKAIVGLVKATSNDTKVTLDALLSPKI